MSEVAATVALPIVPIALQQLRELRAEHIGRRFHLVPRSGFGPGLDGNPEALVNALLQLSIECLTIHVLAEAEPTRPVAEILALAVDQLKRS